MYSEWHFTFQDVVLKENKRAAHELTHTVHRRRKIA